ncbi:ABC transporter permease [Shimia sagamensis]|uniref:ABC transport system permease protein n=1 Tax=Shimia sagamensis TaxID=1566352 RepID=A0ABY1NYT7_9RHOB|nr:ABC transporter permease [Shimia sagamensis]SMP22250.1 putative ABC transport system permease protein [Shimia sagamensis]
MTLVLQSLWNRRFVATLTVLAIALSVALILSVERLRDSARTSFANSASGIDLIIAPRGNDVQILLATVFGVGSTGAGLSGDVVHMVEDMPGVAWAVPLMQGDNHQGFPVIGTSSEYFEHFKHSRGQALSFAKGGAFIETHDAVIGAEVAERLGYTVGTEIINAHGAGAVALEQHDEAPFEITGVLTRTHTAVDRMVFISLAGFDELHVESARGSADPFAALAEADHASHDNEHDHDHGFVPDQINAIYIGLSNRTAVLGVQRAVATYKAEPLAAVMPNVALLQLWSITGTAENALRLMSVAVVAASMIGMVVMLSAALEARRREFAILRSVGAAPRDVVWMIVLEALLVTAAGITLGLVIFWSASLIAEPLLSARFGVTLGGQLLNAREVMLLLTVLCFGGLASLLPAWRVYRMTLADGLTTRL